MSRQLRSTTAQGAELLHLTIFGKPFLSLQTHFVQTLFACTQLRFYKHQTTGCEGRIGVSDAGGVCTALRHTAVLPHTLPPHPKTSPSGEVSTSLSWEKANLLAKQARNPHSRAGGAAAACGVVGELGQFGMDRIQSPGGCSSSLFGPVLTTRRAKWAHFSSTASLIPVSQAVALHGGHLTAFIWEMKESSHRSLSPRLFQLTLQFLDFFPPFPSSTLLSSVAKAAPEVPG